MTTIPVKDVVFRKDLYPRIEHSQAKVQEYAAIIELLPPIEVNQRNELIDGFHRWTAHRMAKADVIKVNVTETSSDTHLLALAIDRNSAHGLSLSQEDKKLMARKLYQDETSWAVFTKTASDRAQVKRDLAIMLKASSAKLSEWLNDIDSAMREERRKKIANLWLRCYTAEEIGERVGLTQQQTTNELSQIFSDLKKFVEVQFSEKDFAPPLYNVWSFAKLTNSVEHFGNTEQRIVDNLLWLCTEPGDIVVDPFAGGGSTLDVCIKRGRRCWVSDRKPKPGLEDKVRELDVCNELPPLNKRWSDVSLVYLDPPYWKQAEGQYSDDKEDLANMPLQEFTERMVKLVKALASKLENGKTIALIIQPTQWKSEPKGKFTDHVFDILTGVGTKTVEVENRISAPYSTQQCTPQMVEWAKENKKPLVLSRELIVWKVAK